MILVWRPQSFQCLVPRISSAAKFWLLLSFSMVYIMLFIVFSFAWWVLVGDSRHCNIRLDWGVTEQSPNEPYEFYHNAPTRDIRLFMQSFSNE
ncbi:hypothetical protein OROHE_020744 [Orobanche hederae]